MVHFQGTRRLCFANTARKVMKIIPYNNCILNIPGTVYRKPDIEQCKFHKSTVIDISKKVLNEPFIIKFDSKLIDLANITASKIQESFEFRSTQSLDKTFMKYGVMLDEFIGRSFRHCSLEKTHV